jgi:tol-pal system protein YbgF
MRNKILLASLVSTLSVAAFADAPVVAATPVDTSAQATAAVPDNSSATSAPNLSVLQQKVDNLTKLNLAQQISQLQQQNQDLTGQVQVLQHDMKTLNDQLRNFYQDLDKRITQIVNLNPSLNTGGPDASDKGDKAKPASDVKAVPMQKPQVVPATKKKTNTNPGPQASSAEVNSYQAAFQLVTSKQYSQATTALQAYMQQYPNGAYVADATYWLGEVALMQKDTATALANFQNLAKNFPQSAKLSDAQYKIALILMHTGHTDEASKKFQDVQNNYPNSTAAQLASIRLQQMQS